MSSSNKCSKSALLVDLYKASSNICYETIRLDSYKYNIERFFRKIAKIIGFRAGVFYFPLNIKSPIFLQHNLETYSSDYLNNLKKHFFPECISKFLHSNKLYTTPEKSEIVIDRPEKTSENTILIRKIGNSGPEAGFIGLLIPLKFINDLDVKKAIARIAKDIEEGIRRFKQIANPYSDHLLTSDNQRFEKLFNSMAEGYAFHELLFDCAGDPVDYRYLNLNKRTANLLGLPLKEIIGRKASEIFHGNSPYLEIYANVSRSGRPYFFETYFTPMDKHFMINVFSFKKDTFTTIFLDITEKRKTELKLQESEKKFQNLFQKAPLAYQSLNSEGKIIDANTTWFSIFGFKKEEVIGKSFGDFFATDAPKPFHECFKNFYKKGEIKNTEFRLKSKSGKTKTVLINGRIAYDNKGNFERTHCIIQDITREKAIKAKLLDQQRKNQKYFESCPDGMLLIDSNLTILEINKHFHKELGYSPKELIGKNISQFVVLDQRKRLSKLIEAPKIDSEQSQNLNFIKKNQKQIILNIVCTHFKKNQYICFSRDITKSLESKLERKKLQAQLRQAQKMDTLGTLIGGIAHDFNNIMTPISGHAELLLTNAAEKTPEYEDIQSILSATTRAKELVRQIMTFSRNVENKIEIIHLPTLISEIIKLLKATIPKTIKLELNIADDCPLINGDSTQIHQLIMNLCTNAYHAIEKKKGNISITLRTANSEDTQKYPEIQSQKFVLIEIKDDGVGIPNKIIDRIFDPFFTTKPAGKGTGLGLSVVHGIIEEHNGKIKVDSKPAKETKFSVYLPVTEKKAQKKPSKSKLRKPRSGNEKLLIIDDEVAITHFIKKSLSKIGYDVTISNDSYKAFNLITEGQIKFDLIILDLNMPNLTGLELAQKLRDASIKQPIILITGSDVQEEEILSNKAIYSLIRKPFLVCELEKEIGQILESTS